ncbi:NUDIX hydrolase [uncultured Roseobacter sp.]|uniref:NUDIX hydrolase n=1 Tax=uncultured Roseobacter sp. TaxID=114847 RepID=UPI002613A6B8|nr:NUDIX hydrolase [uncultured Roseobacter sp.]
MKSHFDDALRLFLGPVRERQVAAVCLRRTSEGDEVLLVTSRGTGRWIVPKGWPIKGLSDAEAALQEAWEEAGVRAASVEEDPIGSYDYEKRRKQGEITPVQAKVYLAKVESLADSYPEDHQRSRRWFSPAEAASRVQEPQLQALLRAL